MSYIKQYFTTFVLVMALIGGFNWFIDPFGMFWSPSYVGLNQDKSEAGKRVRISKAYVARNANAQVLLVGNSRVEMGIDPSSSWFAGQQVYNQAMPGAGIQRQVDYAIDAIEQSPQITRLFVGVDLFDFLLLPQAEAQAASETKAKAEYSQRLVSPSWSAQLFKAKEQASMVLSIDATMASIRTILAQGSNVHSLNKQGFNSAKGFIQTMRFEGIKPLFKQKLQEINQRIGTQPLPIDYSGGLIPGQQHLKRLLDKAKERGIETFVFINPYHSSYLHVIHELGYWEKFVDWKSHLIDTVSEYPAGVHLWDFSGLNEFTLEPVTLDTPKTQMQWYWEPAHYKKELGELMLERLITGGNKEGFGSLLTNDTLKVGAEKDWARLKADKQNWQNLRQALNL